jgi:Rps23 Pro-64 3,4-dihydroxylase Tpa1-like proline 4-hydroxylase
LYKWNLAKTNDREDIIEARNCVDFKYSQESLGSNIPYNQDLYDIYSIINNKLDECLAHYEKIWNFSINYKEVFNFVKYMPGKYFKIHADHGPYYTCTVSAVIYLNDDYEGGELDFVRQQLKIKPSVGDIFLFPSNFVYEHASCEVISGTKYSVVVMLDYNDKYHKNNV